MNQRQRLIRRAGVLAVTLVSAALLLSSGRAALAQQDAGIRVSVDSLTLPKFIMDPHPPFRERVTAVLGDSGDKLLSWGGFDSAALICDSPDASQCFATRPDGGASVFVINPGDSARTYRIELKLPRGLYKVESRILPGTGDVQPRRSLALASAGVRAITGSLPAKSVLAVRVTDLIQEAEGQIDLVSQALPDSSLSNGRSDRIGNCLAAAKRSVERVQKRLGSTDRANLAGDIHEGMLLASQAEAMLRNAVMQGQISQSASDKMDSNLMDMRTALSGISAACFDLFPMIALEPIPGQSNASMLVLTLVNRGTKPVSLINFAVKPPEGWTATPIGYTLFARLGPGESLSAHFALGPPSNLAPDASVVIRGDISYFASHSAAHLPVAATVKLSDAR